MDYRLSSMVLALVVLASSTAATADSFGIGVNQFSIDFVPISGATNPASGPGIVNNDYRMGIYEITNDQWNKFKATNGTPTGSPSSGYDDGPVFPGPNVPTNGVSWYEAAQFANWLNTSTGHHAAYKFTGTQGTGDYTFATWNSAESANGTNLYRHKDAIYYLPTENEWVKAEYWNGTALQPFANASGGDLVIGVPDTAKWNYSGSATSEPWNVGSGIRELNGTYDMMGNVWEWMESPYSDANYAADSSRGLRGGSYNNTWDRLHVSDRLGYPPTNESYNSGFRVASSAVPEPGSLTMLAGIAVMGLLYWRRKRA